MQIVYHDKLKSILNHKLLKILFGKTAKEIVVHICIPEKVELHNLQRSEWKTEQNCLTAQNLFDPSMFFYCLRHENVSQFRFEMHIWIFSFFSYVYYKFSTLLYRIVDSPNFQTTSAQKRS